MLKKVLFVMTMLSTALPMAAGATTAWQLTARVNNAGGSLTVRGGAPTSGTFFKIYTTSQNVPVVITASSGYNISSIAVNGVATSVPGSPATYQMGLTPYPGKTSQAVSVYFAKQLYAVTATAGVGGVVSPTGTVNLGSGSAASYTFTPNTGNQVVAINGAPAGATYTDTTTSAPATFPAPVNHAVRVAFSVPAASVNLSGVFVSLVANAGAPQTVLAGQTVTLNGSATPSAGATYAWTKTGGPALAGEDLTATPPVVWTSALQNPTFPAVANGTYNFHLVATSGTVSATSDTFVVVTNSVVAAARNQCQSCHQQNGVGSATNVFSNWSAGTGHGTKAAICAKCHIGADTGAHPGTKSTKVSVNAVAGVQPVQSGDNQRGNGPATGYAGSTTCQACHTDKFASWSNTLHNKPLKQLSETTNSVLVNKTLDVNNNDFVTGINFNNYSGNGVTGHTVLVDKYGKKYPNPFGYRAPNAPILSVVGSVPQITIGNVTYPITRAHGGNGKWKQRYQTKIGNAYYVLNVMYNEGNGRYAEYNPNNWYQKDLTTTPYTKIASDNIGNQVIFNNPLTLVADVKAANMFSSTTFNGNESGPSNSSWDNRCTGCHQTGMTAKFEGDATNGGEVVAGYVELNIGCEACHGQGAAHKDAPSSGNILNPQTAFVGAATPNYFKADETCGQCHNRTEGAGKLGADATHLVNLSTEAPSAENAGERTSTTFYNIADTNQHLNAFVEKYDPGVWGTVDNSGVLQYDGANFPKFAASNKHHQTFQEIQQGKHGAAWQSQAGNSKGLSCWSCHDPHAANSSNMKSSINGVATNKDDNTLCLACHAEGGDFTALPKSSIGNLSAELGVVNTHLNAKLGYVGLDAGQYLSSVTKAGTSFPAFGNNTIKVGNCVSCHMPLTVVSGIQRDPATGLTAGKNVRGVGDVHNHTMKTVKASEVNGKIVLGGAVNGKAGGAASADGLPSATNTGVMTSCSVCHVPTDAAPSTGGNWW